MTKTPGRSSSCRASIHRHAIHSAGRQTRSCFDDLYVGGKPVDSEVCAHCLCVEELRNRLDAMETVLHLVAKQQEIIDLQRETITRLTAGAIRVVPGQKAKILPFENVKRRGS